MRCLMMAEHIVHFRMSSTCRLKSLVDVVGVSIFELLPFAVISVVGFCWSGLFFEAFGRRVFACNENHLRLLIYWRSLKAFLNFGRV